MVSAGLDTIPGNLIMGIGYLSTPEGQLIQRKAYDAIMTAYPKGDAWNHCMIEEKVPYVTAFYKEVLRFFTVIPISLPRVNIKDIHWNGIKFPAGTTFYMNAYAADYDEQRFSHPYDFNPERYMPKGDEDSKAHEGTPHFGYGAGSRMCAGSHLANRELFVAFVRLLCAFEIVEGKDANARPVIDCLEASDIPTSLTMEPKRFKVGLRVRDENKLKAWITESESATKALRQGVSID
jgi:phenylacetate 2-hydroxylase